MHRERSRAWPRITGHWGSVRTRTTIAAAVVVGLALVIGSAALLITLRHALVSSADDLSRARSEELAGQAAKGTLHPVVTDVGDDGVAQVVTADGTVLASSSGLTGHRPITESVPAPGTFEQLTLRDIPDDSDREDYRVWATSIDSTDGPIRVYVGNSLESVSEAVATVRNSLFVGVPALLALVAATAWMLTGRALRPVEDIRAEVATISEQELDRRVPSSGGDDEIARLAATMNDMLARLEAAAARQREFVSDASHELQSPLASFRAQLEVAIAHPVGVDWPGMAVDLLADSDRMERLVRDLLYLAKQDADFQRQFVEVDFDVLIVEECSPLASHAGVEINTRGVSAMPVRGSGDDLRRMIRNVVDNAATHARSAVVVETEERGDAVALIVTDDGPGIAPEFREAIFERFTRLDGARTRGVLGTGLGLAIARGIAREHDGDITVDDAPETHSGARFVAIISRSPVATRRQWPTAGR
jgi:signal transduction histidine kinase